MRPITAIFFSVLLQVVQYFVT